MAADLDKLRDFIESLPDGQPIGLNGGPTVTRTDLIDVHNELAELRDAADEGGADAELLQARLADYIDSLGGPDNVDPELCEIAGLGEPEPPTALAGFDPDAAAGRLAQLGLPADPQLATALAQLLLGDQAPAADDDYEDEDEDEEQEPPAAPLRARRPAMPATQTTVRRAVPVKKLAPVKAKARGVPGADPRDRPGGAIRYGVRKQPKPQPPITAEQLFGTPRGKNGRFDNGNIDG